MNMGWSVEVWPWGKRSDSEGLLTKVRSRFSDVLCIRQRLRDCGSVDFLVIKSGLDWKSVIRDLTLVALVRRYAQVIILQPHGSQVERLARAQERLFKWAVAHLLARVEGVFLLSSDEVNAVASFSPQTPVYQVRNPYDPACLDSTPISIEASRMNVLFVGRMVREKGLLDIVCASADAEGRGVLDITFVGQGPAEGEARRLAESLGLKDSVHFLGLGDAESLHKAYLNADVLALPTYWPEGFPTVLAEAMGFGLPIVCTAIRGATDYLIDGVNAVFVEPKDPAGLRKALLDLRDDPEMRRRMSESNLERVRLFEPSIVARHYGECIVDVIARKQREADAS